MLITDYVEKNPKHIKELKNDEVGFRYVHGVANIIDSVGIKVFEKSLGDYPDITKKVYEGGFKIWECELDGVRFLLGYDKTREVVQGKRVLELGCGSGLIGLACAVYGANSVAFQDYNKEVLVYHTASNIFLNKLDQNKGMGLSLIGGSWEDMLNKKQSFHVQLSDNKTSTQSYDLIFGADILYEIENYTTLLNLFNNLLSDNGRVIIISKMYYYGNGGSLYEFQDYIEKDGRFVYNTLTVVNQSSSNKREVFELTRKSGN